MAPYLDLTNVTATTTIIPTSQQIIWVNGMTSNSSAKVIQRDGKTWFKFGDLFEYSSTGDLNILAKDNIDEALQLFIKSFKTAIDTLLLQGVAERTQLFKDKMDEAIAEANKLRIKNDTLEKENKEVHKVLNSNRFSDI